MLKQTEQTTRKYRIAALNARLHQNGICPGNHNVEYANGWYYYDEDAQQRPGVTARADELESRLDVEVFYQEAWNTYILSEIGAETGMPIRGSVHV